MIHEEKWFGHARKYANTPADEISTPAPLPGPRKIDKPPLDLDRSCGARPPARGQPAVLARWPFADSHIEAPALASPDSRPGRAPPSRRLRGEPGPGVTPSGPGRGRPRPGNAEAAAGAPGSAARSSARPAAPSPWAAGRSGEGATPSGLGSRGEQSGPQRTAAPPGRGQPGRASGLSALPALSLP